MKTKEERIEAILKIIPDFEKEKGGNQMVEVNELWGYDDYAVYYTLVGDDVHYDLTANKELLGKVFEVIRKYYEEVIG